MRRKRAPTPEKAPFPVCFSSHSARGRELVATAGVEAGALLLRCLPLVLTPNDAHQHSHCAACLSVVAAPVLCPARCSSVLCAACTSDERWAAQHDAGECVSLRHLARLRAEDATPGDSVGLRLLLRLAYSRVVEQSSAAPAAPTECPHGEAIHDEFSAVAELVTQLDDLSEAQLTPLVALAQTARRCLVASARQHLDAVMADAAALACNAMEVSDAASGAAVGEGLWLTAAMGLNHSCVPNCDWVFESGNAGAMAVRALRDVRANEPLTISYCNLFQSGRREALQRTFHFTCRCRRCNAGDAAPEVPQLAAFCAAAVAACDWASASRCGLALEALVAPLVAGGAHWARLTLARARWAQLLAAGDRAERRLAEELAAELRMLLGDEHSFAAQACAVGRTR